MFRKVISEIEVEQFEKKNVLQFSSLRQLYVKLLNMNGIDVCTAKC